MIAPKIKKAEVFLLIDISFMHLNAHSWKNGTKIIQIALNIPIWLFNQFKSDKTYFKIMFKLD
jgi:hypothetical protein